MCARANRVGPLEHWDKLLPGGSDIGTGTVVLEEGVDDD